MAGVGQARKIVEGGGASVEYGSEFGVEFLFDMRILREEHPSPGKGAGGGFVSGEEQSEGFVAKLLGGHAGAVFILGVNQQREKVAGVVVGIATLLDDAVDDLGEIADGALGLKIAAGGKPLRGHDEATEVGSVLEECMEIFADLRGIAGDVSVEERFANDLQSEAHHGFVQIKLLEGAPGLQEVVGAFRHGGGVICDAIAMKGGLHHAALAQPEFSFTGEEAVAEEMTIGAEDAALDEFFVVGDEDIFDLIGVKEEIGADVEEAKADDVAVFAGGAGHEGERILAEGTAEAVEETLFGAGRVEGGSESGHGEMVCDGGEKEKWESGRKWPFEAQGKRVGRRQTIEDTVGQAVISCALVLDTAKRDSSLRSE